MLNENYATKYFPQTLNELPLENNFIHILQKCISNSILQILLVGDDDYIKLMVLQTIIKTLEIPRSEQLFISQIKDQGVTNMRYEIKHFSQTPSPNSKKILIIDDIHMFSENIQKLFINNIDKWSKNIYIIVTCNNLYSVDECLVSRLFPLNIPEMKKETLVKHIDKICHIENILLNNSHHEFIIKIAESNLQTIYHILHKCKLLQYDKKINYDLLKQTSTLIHIDEMSKYFNIAKQGELKKGYEYLLTISEKGYSVLDILNEMYLFIKITTLLNEEEKYLSCKIISSYIVHFITIHEEELELLLLTQEIIEILHL
jgi:DNA polymerase III gamma/tau subunit